jgi:DNA-binding NtrC family response regulator
MGRILVVDDEQAQRDIMREILVAESHEVAEAGSVEEALRIGNELHPDLVLTDLKMPNRGGLQLVEALAKSEHPPEIVVITAYGTIETAVKAIRLGAYDYLTKPIDGDGFLRVVQRALEKAEMRRETRRLREELARRVDAEIIAVSEPMRKLLDTVSRVADTDATVLIRGESGTGKEKVARMLHAKSRRRDKPFQGINCAAFPESLLESELFGHEKGSFTGAHARKIGLIETAAGGTLFLDEIGDMAPNTQTKILRVLQEREFRRVGGTATVRVEVRSGSFREDLFYRLNVIPMVVPPLRDRPEDIPALVEHFLARSSRGKSIEKEALDSLRKYSLKRPRPVHPHTSQTPRYPINANAIAEAKDPNPKGIPWWSRGAASTLSMRNRWRIHRPKPYWITRIPGVVSGLEMKVPSTAVGKCPRKKRPQSRAKAIWRPNTGNRPKNQPMASPMAREERLGIHRSGWKIRSPNQRCSQVSRRDSGFGSRFSKRARAAALSFFPNGKTRYHLVISR